MSRQEKCVFSWLFSSATKKIVPFLGRLAEPPWKWSVSLAVLVSYQENGVFSWLLCWVAKKIVKTTCIFHISLFNPKLKFLIHISLIWTQNLIILLPKIFKNHDLSFNVVCFYVDFYSWIFYELFSSIQIENIKICFRIKINLVTS